MHAHHKKRSLGLVRRACAVCRQREGGCMHAVLRGQWFTLPLGRTAEVCGFGVERRLAASDGAMVEVEHQNVRLRYLDDDGAMEAADFRLRLDFLIKNGKRVLVAPCATVGRVPA